MKTIENRQVKCSRGRFLGGSSGVNGTLCIRGTKQDYDDWGLEEWTGEKMFGYMAKAFLYLAIRLPLLTLDRQRPSTTKTGSKPTRPFMAPQARYTLNHTI